MATGHPLDDHGRVSPDPGWPHDRAAPGALDLLRRFCNTENVESGADRLATVASARQWLAAERIPCGRLTGRDVDRLHELRTALRGQFIGHNERGSLADTGPGIGPLTSRLRFRPVVTGDGLDPAVGLEVERTDAFSVVAGRLLLLVVDAQTDDRWTRFKACRHCCWIFYDASKNRSGTWCSMRACGGRAKVRAYRDRRRTTG